MKTDILGVRFDALTLSEAAEAAGAMLDRGEGGTVVTANPEIVLRTRKDEAYRQAVNGADLVLADGVGDLLAARILGTPLPERVTGADLTPLLLQRLARTGGGVFLYGGKPGVAERAGENLRAACPGLRIAGTENGYIQDETALLRRLETDPPPLLLLGLGAPRQELWMAQNRRLPSVMIGVGGLLDVFAGDVDRAPASWRKLGLEWLYRLAQEPRRLGRMSKLPGILTLALRERKVKRKAP
ncbi:MAG: WecB/TagA/CpsF family glycosyltransferase [Oscillospiraceae bacterium]|nr:WecB/TagA/CpsF family glycosyltransferase [Oscillospiraceae bacterium]